MRADVTWVPADCLRAGDRVLIGAEDPQAPVSARIEVIEKDPSGGVVWLAGIPKPVRFDPSIYAARVSESEWGWAA